MDIKREISNLENELKSLDINKNNNKLDYIFNNTNPKHHYLLRSKKLQKHFNIKETVEHSDRYNIKEFWANTTNRKPLIFGGMLTPLIPTLGIGITLCYKIGYKIAQKKEINNYIANN